MEREDVKEEDGSADKPNVIVTSFNRNFRGRNDANKARSLHRPPEVVVAKVLAARSRSSRHDTLPGADGSPYCSNRPAARAPRARIRQRDKASSVPRGRTPSS